MIRELGNSFKQASLGSIIWVSILITLFNKQQLVPLSYIWNVLGIGLLLGFIFGVVYPYLWNYATLKAYITIVLSSILNTMTGFLAIYLYSTAAYLQIKPFILMVLGLTVVGHTLGFYFYRKIQNIKLAQELSRLVK